MTDDIAAWDAAYILGALSQEDRRIYEAHLAANPERAAALTELADLPLMLNALSREEAVALIEPGCQQLVRRGAPRCGGRSR